MQLMMAIHEFDMRLDAQSRFELRVTGPMAGQSHFGPDHWAGLNSQAIVGLPLNAVDG